MGYIEVIYLIVVLSLIIMTIINMYYEKKAGICPAPTLPWVKSKMINALIKYTDNNKDYKISELGCGWGGIIKTLTRKFPNSRINGYEISFFPYYISKIRNIWKN